MSRLAARAAHLSGSPMAAITATVDRLRREGVDIVDFGAGEPDFATPPAIDAAARAALDQHFTKYTPVAGIAELKQAICDRYRADYGVEYAPSEVIATAGGKHALYNTALALFDPGDEVIIHTPYWPTLADQVKFVDAVPVFVETTPANGFAITSRLFLDAVTDRTRGIIINSPCNPTGAVVTEADLTEVAREAARRRIWVVLDLCYEHLIYGDVPHNLPAVLVRECRDLTVICGSASKSYAMTGWRCGWAIAPKDVITAEAALQSNATSNISSITQKAAVAALAGSQEPVKAMLAEYRTRRDQLHQWLTADPRLKCAKPVGAFYMFVDVRGAMSAGEFATSADFARVLLDEARVAVAPGEAFGAPGFVRISFATSMDNLREGSRRILEFVSAHARQPQAAG